MKRKVNVALIESYKRYSKREKEPFEIAYDKINTIAKLLDVVEDNSKNYTIIYEARLQAITALISIMEFYFKELLAIIIEEENIPFETILKEDKIDLKELKMFYDEDVSFGFLVANTFNFQNLKEIEKTFTRLIRTGFLEKLKDVQFFYKKGEEAVAIEKGFVKIIDDFIKLRHLIVHDQGLSVKIEKNKLGEFLVTLRDFILFSDILIGNSLKFIKRNRPLPSPFVAKLWIGKRKSSIVRLS